MTAAKHTDPFVGMDMHLVQPPMGPPIMVPIPVVGMIMDPADYQPGASTVCINGLPRARAGTCGVLSPPHVPAGGVFVVAPSNDAELYQGSSTVTVNGDALSATGHQVLGCSDAGSPAPVRSWKSASAKALMAAGSVVLAIPAGAPVNVGGAPTVSASASAEDTAGPAFIEIDVTDPDGNPVVGVSYLITLGDGTTRRGVVGESGRIAYYGIPAEDVILRLFA